MPTGPSTTSLDDLRSGADHALAAEAIEAPAWDGVGGRPAAWSFLTFLGVWIMLLFAVAVTWPGQDHGTRMADSNILNAGRNFEAHGLGFHHGVPSLETYEDAERPPALYGTYPPGPYWIHALIRGTGLDSLSEVRGASVVGAGVAGVMALVAFGVLTRSWLAGALAASFYCFSAPFAAWSDSLHMKVWMQIALLAFLAAWAGFERARGPGRWALLALAGTAYLADIWLNLEHVLLIAIVVAVRTIISRRWSIWIGGAILAGVAALGIASRVWHLTLEFDTIEGVREYLTRKYGRRSGEAGGGADGFGITDVASPWLAQLGWSGAPGRGRLRELGYPFLSWPVMLSAGALFLLMLWTRVSLAWRRRPVPTAIARTSGAGPGPITAVLDARVWPLRSARAGLGWGVLLLAASLHWHLWMRQHASAHPHVILNMLPGMALILGSLAAGGLRLAAPDARGLGRLRGLGVPIAVVLSACFALHLRDAAPLNRLFRLSPLHQELRARTAADQWWRDLGTGLADRFDPVRRVVLYHWGPRQANLIGLPHQYVEGGGMPASFGMAGGTWSPTGAGPAQIAGAVGNTGIPAGPGNDLLLIEFPRPGKPPAVPMRFGFERFGFPEIETGPETTALVFSPVVGVRDGRFDDAPTATADIEAWRAGDLHVHFAANVRLRAVRLAPTITGRAWVLCVDLRGPGSAPFPAGSRDRDPGSQAESADASSDATPASARLFLRARVITPGSPLPRTFVSLPSHRVRHEGRAFLWVVLDKNAIAPGSEVRFSLGPRGHDARLPINDPDELPAGLRVDGDEIVWRVPAP